MLVATVILAVAIAGLMSALSGSMRVAGTAHRLRSRGYARPAQDGRDYRGQAHCRAIVLLQGAYDPTQTNGSPSGWRVRIAPFEVPPNPTPGIPIVDRIHVQVWWMNGEAERTFDVEGFRRYYLTAQDVAAGCSAMRSSARGITLMELLVAITLLSLLSVGVLFGLRIGLNAMERSNDRLMTNRKVLGVERVITQQIAGIMPVIGRLLYLSARSACASAILPRRAADDAFRLDLFAE